jgi:hypothetical protein
LLLQECQQTSGQGPETQNGLCRHDLIGIATQEVLVVLKEGFQRTASVSTSSWWVSSSWVLPQ